MVGKLILKVAETCGQKDNPRGCCNMWSENERVLLTRLKNES